MEIVINRIFKNTPEKSELAMSIQIMIATNFKICKVNFACRCRYTGSDGKATPINVI